MEDDRGESLNTSIYRIKLETYTRRQVLYLIAAFMSIFLLSLVAGAASPYVWRSTYGDGTAWDNCTQVAHKSECQACVTYWTGEIIDMQPYHQLLYLEVAMENPLMYISDWASPTFDPTDPTSFFASEVLSTPPKSLDFNIRMDMSVSGIKADGAVYPIVPFSTVSRRVKCNDASHPF
eukprot:g4342.t1